MNTQVFAQDGDDSPDLIFSSRLWGVSPDLLSRDRDEREVRLFLEAINLMKAHLLHLQRLSGQNGRLTDAQLKEFAALQQRQKRFENVVSLHLEAATQTLADLQATLESESRQ